MCNIPYAYGQVFSVQLVYGLHSHGVSYDISLADSDTGSSTIYLRLSQRDRQARLYGRQHRQGKSPI